MSVMRDDDQIQQPLDPHGEVHVTHLADLVGRGVAYDQGDADPRHGTIVQANYSTGGEAVLIVHPDSRPCEVLADTVLMGRQAKWALEHLDSAGDPLSIDATARHRLNAEQALAIPDAANLTPAAVTTR